LKKKAVDVVDGFILGWLMVATVLIALFACLKSSKVQKSRLHESNCVPEVFNMTEVMHSRTVVGKIDSNGLALFELLLLPLLERLSQNRIPPSR
jgi:hypothetical protein